MVAYPTTHLNEDLLTSREAAAYLNLNYRTLEVWRSSKKHRIPYLKVGRLVRYRRTDLDDWLEARTQDGGAK